MRQIIRYETCDGRQFSAKEDAERYERSLDRGKHGDDADIYWVALDPKRAAEWVFGPREAGRP